MNIKLFYSITSLLSSSFFSQVALSDAFTAKCFDDDQKDKSAMFINLIVNNDWRKAIVFPSTNPDSAQNLICNGQKEMKNNFVCHSTLVIPSVGSIEITFLRNTQNLMTLRVLTEIEMDEDETFRSVDILSYTCFIN